MPEITFCKNNRILACSFNGHQIPKYGDIYEGIEEAWDDIDEEHPFQISEKWYIAGIKHPFLVAIDSNFDEYDEPVAPWKIYYNQQYAEKHSKGYSLIKKGNSY